MVGGEIGIRTLDRLPPILDFESSAFDHSAISPRTADYTDFMRQPRRAGERYVDRKEGAEAPARRIRPPGEALRSYFLAGATIGAAAFAAEAGMALAAGAVSAVVGAGPICGVTTLPFAFCSAI